MTPAVRRLLREHGLTAAQIVGTGGGGRITREDVIDHVESVRTGKPVGAQAAERRLDGSAPTTGVDAGTGRQPGAAARATAAARPRRPSSSRPARTRSSSR